MYAVIFSSLYFLCVLLFKKMFVQVQALQPLAAKGPRSQVSACLSGAMVSPTLYMWKAGQENFAQPASHCQVHRWHGQDGSQTMWQHRLVPWAPVTQGNSQFLCGLWHTLYMWGTFRFFFFKVKWLQELWGKANEESVFHGNEILVWEDEEKFGRWMITFHWWWLQNKITVLKASVLYTQKWLQQQTLCYV